MLPESDRLTVQEFYQALIDLAARVQIHPVEIEAVISQVESLPPQYQQQMAPILANAEELGVAQARSLATEFQRSLRLLETDGLFLKAAKSPAIQQQRLKVLCDRLQTLIGYCQVILEVNDRESPAS